MSLRITSLRLIVIGWSITLLAWGLASGRVWADHAPLIMCLKSGDHLSGSLVPATKPKHIAIQCDAFEKPLEFPVQAISCLDPQMLDAADLDANELQFVLTNHTILNGTLQSWTADEVQIQSRSLGAITLPRNLLSEVVNAAGASKPLFVGPYARQAWESPRNTSAWRSQGGRLVSNIAGVLVRCDVKIPAKSEISLALGWDNLPEFSMGFGCATSAEVPFERRDAAFAMLETWGKSLTIARRNAKQADFAVLAELKESSNIALRIFMDHQEGSVVVCSPAGKVLGKLTVKPTNRLPLSGLVELLNATDKQDALRLERLEVREWNGLLPHDSSVEGSGIATVDGTVSTEQVIGFDPKNQVLQLEAADKSRRQIPLAHVARVALAPRSSQPTGEELIELRLRDESTCIGVFKSSQTGQLELDVPGFSAPLSCNLDQILCIAGGTARFELDEDQLHTPVGSLESDSLKLRGALVESSQPGQLTWHVLGAIAPGTLSQRFSGSIVYDKSQTATASKPQLRQTSPARGAIVAQAGRMPAPAPQMAEVSVDETSQEAARSGGSLGFRSGDEALGQVHAIDEQGVVFKQGNLTKKIPHDKIDCVTLVEHATSHKPPAEKLKQLLTIPRAAKADPPTHLFVGANGDFLRGRLISYADNQVTAEIRLENVQFPKGAITQIYWLYSRQWELDKDKRTSEKDAPTPGKIQPGHDGDSSLPADSELLAVHAIQSGEKPITLTPTQISMEELGGQSQQVLRGRNDLLGDCQIRLANVKRLLISRDVGNLVRQSKNVAWSLSVAALPRAYREGEESAATRSPLVGKPAPAFTLQTVNGQPFSLADLTGRVVVLDFWASWCGPCMQTMPDVERIVDEVGGGQVQLVAVNLQETAQQAMDAVKRLNLTGTVVLDSDGEVSAKYDASSIPQTVIIDREGQVTHLFVGGGSRFIEEFRAALATVQQSAKP